jgi:hypothetical protein
MIGEDIIFVWIDYESGTWGLLEFLLGVVPGQGL